MFNLLPLTEKKIIKQQYKFRRWVVLLMFFVASGVVGLIFSSPSFFLSSTKKKIAFNQLETIKKVLSSLENDDSDLVLQMAKEKLKILNTLKNYKASSMFGEIIKSKNESIKISRFVSTSDTKTGQQIFISGTALNRSSLVSFKDALKNSNYFSDVVLPVSNLAKEVDIDFSITVFVSPQS